MWLLRDERMGGWILMEAGVLLLGKEESVRGTGDGRLIFSN